MKQINVFMAVVIIGIITLIMFGLPGDIGDATESFEFKGVKQVKPVPQALPMKKAKQPDRVIHFDIQSKIVTRDKVKRPSYCSPRGYEIHETLSGRYKVIFGATGNAVDHPDTEIYDTVEEAQLYINKIAAESHQRWFDSDGAEY